MIVTMPEDFHSYEHKAFGNFTTRQVVCLLLGLVVVAPTYWLGYLLTSSVDVSAIMAMVLGAPVFLCGFMKKDGVYLEKILSAKWEARFKYPSKRKFVMHNFYEDMIALEKELLKYEASDEASPAEWTRPEQDADDDLPAVEKKGYRAKQHPLRKHERGRHRQSGKQPIQHHH